MWLAATSRGRAIHRAILATVGLSLALAGVTLAPAFAQTDSAFVWDPTAFPVEGGGSMPFFGGIGSISQSAKFRFADLDEDGDLDFYSLGPDGRLALYENVGSASDPQFVPKKDNIIDPPIGVPWGWFLFADIDADGTLEMFAGDTPDTNEFGLYENVGTGADPLFQWQPFPAYMDSARDAMDGFGNVPAFEDLDGDGDLDFFHMLVALGIASVNWNIGTPNAPFFSSQVNDFGGINTFIEQLANRNAEIDDGKRHGASIPAFLDLDEDSDLDLIMGDQLLTNVFYFRNDGRADSAAYTLASDTPVQFPVEEPSVQIWTVLGDLDGDDVPELIIGPTDNLGAYESSILLYKDQTPVGEPTWAFAGDTLIYGIDVGSRSLPAIGDIDDDGDDDLLLGHVTRQDFDGKGKPGLVLYENVGTSAAPSFRRVPPEEDPFSAVVRPDLDSPAPVLADMDGDDDLDLLVAQAGLPRHVLYYENQGTPSAPSYRYIDVLLDANIRRRPDNAGAPTLGDLDRDGDLDMLIGEYGNTERPKIYWYDNTGELLQTADGKRPVFSWVASRADSAFGFDTVADSVKGFLVPYLFDSNCDGYLDIWIGARDGRLREYRSRGAGDSLHFDLVTNKFEGIVVGSLSAPAFVDIDDDGDFDMFIGEESGGVNFYRNESGGLRASPTGGGVVLDWRMPSSGPGVIEVLRAEEDGPFETIHEIPQSNGPLFSWVDQSVLAVTRYRYQLDAQGIALACGSFGPVEAVVGLSDVEIAAASAVADTNGVRVAWTASSGYPGLAFRISRSDGGGEFTLVPGGDAIPRAAENVFVDPMGSAASSYRLDALYRESGAPTIAPDSVFTPLVIRAVETVVELRIFAPSPNPARGPVEFFFDLPSETSVALTIFDVSGRLVREMEPLALPSGAQQSIVWDGRDDEGGVVSNGLYLYRIEAGDQTATGRVVHLR
jgi:FG-GAP-like repeat/FlgD Ig-like domain